MTKIKLSIVWHVYNHIITDSKNNHIITIIKGRDCIIKEKMKFVRELRTKILALEI